MIWQRRDADRSAEVPRLSAKACCGDGCCVRAARPARGGLLDRRDLRPLRPAAGQPFPGHRHRLPDRLHIEGSPRSRASRWSASSRSRCSRAGVSGGACAAQHRQPGALARARAGRSTTPVDPAPLSAAPARVLARSRRHASCCGGSRAAVRARGRAAGGALRGADPRPADSRRRADALRDKRGHTDGAALFSILPRARNSSLLRLLVAYQIIWDFLDSVNERGADVGVSQRPPTASRADRRARPRAPISDYYRHHPWREDGGYLRRARRRLPEMLR